MKKRCFDCEFFDTLYEQKIEDVLLDTEKQVIDGWCRRHAPLKCGDITSLDLWPRVLYSDWCGDFEPKEDA